MLLPPCPACGAMFSVDVWLANHDARMFVTTMSKTHPDIASRIPAYLGLFRAPGRSVGWSQGLKILQDLIDLIASGQIDFKGVARPAPPKLWAKGIDQLLSQRSKIDLPLTSHGYLISIVREMADKEDASRERQRDDRSRRLYGDNHAQSNTDQPSQSVDDDHEWTDKRCQATSALAIRLTLALTHGRISDEVYTAANSTLQDIAVFIGEQFPQDGYCSICRYRDAGGQPFIGVRSKPFGTIATKITSARLAGKINQPTFDRYQALLDTILQNPMPPPTPEFCQHACPCRQP